MTTFLCIVDHENGWRGSVLMEKETATVEAARAWFKDFTDGMPLGEGEKAIAISFAGKTTFAVWCEFPFLFEAGTGGHAQ